MIVSYLDLIRYSIRASYLKFRVEGLGRHHPPFQLDQAQDAARSRPRNAGSSIELCQVDIPEVSLEVILKHQISL